MSDPISRNMAALSLEARALAMRRGHRSLFEGLDFTVRPGEALQLAGPNGSGKSTLMRLLAGFLAPDGGAVIWHGVPEERDVVEFIHYHGHREGLRDALSPAENLAFAASLLGGSREAIPAALERLGILHLKDLPVQVLSAGQKRRVALARLFVAPRPVWLLDEPLAALDLEGQKLVGDLVAAHVTEGGFAIVATHQPLGVKMRTITLGGKAAHAELLS
ncbi:MAG: heme ABC exporter ATP-binding protein CcmA [Proteobacteria bacterium]|nr:heme ABC exporter ATP-binding protein CcmA [Pseudomonadota bacterium]